MKIGQRKIGPGEAPYVIAEIGVNHDGEVSRALELTEAAAKAGADAVKLQYFETDRLLSKAAKLAAYQKAAGETDPVAMLRRLELSFDEMAQVVDRAHELGIHAIVTVFSVELVEQAQELKWDAYKSASPDVINKPLLEALKKTKKPLIISTGASEMYEVSMSMEWLAPSRDRIAWLHCVSCYPTPAEDACVAGVIDIYNYLKLQSYKHDGAVAGYSDHTAETDTGALAVRAGAFVLEKHLTYSREAAGPDHSASLEADKFAEYVDLSLRSVLAPIVEQAKTMAPLVMRMMHGDGEFVDEEKRLDVLLLSKDVRYGKPTKECQPFEEDVQLVARQSLTTTSDLKAGDKLKKKHLTIKRPGTGIEPFRLNEVIGKKLVRDVECDMPLLEEDLA